MSQIIFNGNGVEGAYFRTFSASDASSCAIFHREGTFFFVHAGDEDFATFGTFFANFYHPSWTSATATAATATNRFIYYGQVRCLINTDCVEETSFHAIAASQASVGAAAFTGKQHIGKSAAAG